MKTIPLTRGLFAQVDDSVFEWASKFKWHALKSLNTFYAARHIPLPNGKQAYQYLHREILKAPPGVFVDHIDGDGLNDLGENIRLCAHAENLRNRTKQRNNTSGYKSVSWDRQHRKWEAYIKVDGRKIHLGYFDTTIEAARAYDRAAWKYFGKFARFNFPRPWLKLV